MLVLALIATAVTGIMLCALFLPLMLICMWIDKWDVIKEWGPQAALYAALVFLSGWASKAAWIKAIRCLGAEEKMMPNQAPEPTTTAVTSAAEQPPRLL